MAKVYSICEICGKKIKDADACFESIVSVELCEKPASINAELIGRGKLYAELVSICVGCWNKKQPIKKALQKWVKKTKLPDNAQNKLRTIL